jgi:hypothetical protein
MNRHTRTIAVLLAAALQVMPLLRNIVTAPAAGSSFAIILRWTLGSSAALGAFDAVSRASTSPYFMPAQTNFVLTQGIFFTNSFPYTIIVTNTKTDPGAYFVLSNTVTHIKTAQLGDLSSSTLAVPAGLTVKCYDFPSKNYLYLAVYGTPTTVTATTQMRVEGGYSGAPSVYTNIFMSVVALGSPPTITNQPVSATVVAGGTTNFTVLAGTPPLNYQWYFNTNTALAAATNSSLSLTNIRLSQVGAYTVIITNSSGGATSSPALLGVTLPSSPALQSPDIVGGKFQFTFNPVVGLTNSVVTNSAASGGSWVALTNIPPPANASPVTVTDALGSSNRFYRVQIIP